MEYVINKKCDGITVLEFINKNVGISRAHLKHIKFIDDGILVDGKRVTVRYRLSEGECLSLSLEDSDADDTHIEPVDLPIDIIYEDENCVVPSKSGNMPTHPSHGHYDDTVANALAARYSKSGEPFVFRPINRLDRNTSGLLLIARNRLAAARLSESMREGKIKKQYIAVLDGIPEETDGIIETYLRRTAESIIVREVCGKDDGGDYALTEYKVIATKSGHSLVIASPITGRTHQLRVHFAHIGAPILGDDMYGKASPLIGRHALHSAYLSFPSVYGNGRIELFSPPTNDMASVIREFFGEILFDEYFLISRKECNG